MPSNQANSLLNVQRFPGFRAMLRGISAGMCTSTVVCPLAGLFMIGAIAGTNPFAAAADPRAYVMLAPDKATDDFNLGLNFYRTNRPELAAETFAQFLKDFPGHPRRNFALLYYGLSLSTLEKYGEARTQLQAYLKAEPTAPQAADAEYRIAECSYYLREYENAIPQFEAYLQKHAEHKLRPWAQLFLGDSLNGLEQWEKSETILRTLVDTNPDTQVLRDAQFGLARSLEAQKKSEDAIKLYQQIGDDKSSTLAPRALARMGGMYFSQEKFTEAADAYNRAAEASPGNTLGNSAILNSGLALFRAGQYQPCIDRLRNFPEAGDRSAQASLLTALSHKELGQMPEARQEFGRAQQLASDSPFGVDVLFQRAQFERVTDQKEIAAGLFLDISDRYPNDKRVAECLFNAAELKLELADTDAAGRLWNRLNAEFPQQALRLKEQVLGARIQMARREFSAAASNLEKAISAESVPATKDGRRTWVIAHYYFARSAFDGQEDERVVKAVDAVLESLKEPEHANVRSMIALASLSSLRLKDYPATVRYAELFLADATDSAQKADVTAAMAIAFSEQKFFDKAVPVIGQLVTAAPDRPQTWTAVLQSAEAALNDEAWEPAVRLFEIAAGKKDDAEVQEAGLAGIAWTRFKAKQFKDAETAFRILADTFPQSTDAPQAVYMQARCAEEDQNAELAVQLYLNVFDKLAPKEIPAAGAEKVAPMQYVFDSGRQAARILTKLNRLDEADTQWNRLATVFPAAIELDKVLDEWAWMNVDAERFEKSDEIHAQLIRKFPSSPYAGQARLSLAESQMQSGKLEEAAGEFTAIIENPQYAEAEKERAQFHLVDIAVSLRNWKRARELTQAFLTRYPESPLRGQIRLLEAESIVNTSTGAEADAAAYEQARLSLTRMRTEILNGELPADVWHDRVWVLLGEVALATKNYAVIDEIAIELEKRSPESRFLFQLRDVQGRRWKYQSPPDFVKAREYFAMVTQDAIGKGTETAARCQMQIAESFTLQNDLENARKEYLRLYLNYSYPQWRAQGLFQAANCERSLNLRDNAIRSYNDLIREFPESEFIDEARKRLDEMNSGK
ncbi:MAG: tetratricopeptide repeat protein [Planctomyces sp.]|nr:tetratricopeptide repeat protein [Planctomyces sp.]